MTWRRSALALSLVAIAAPGTVGAQVAQPMPAPATTGPDVDRWDAARTIEALAAPGLDPAVSKALGRSLEALADDLSSGTRSLIEQGVAILPPDGETTASTIVNLTELAALEARMRRSGQASAMPATEPLRRLAEQDPETFAAAAPVLMDAIDTAFGHALREGRDIRAVTFLDAEALARFETDAYRSRVLRDLGLPDDVPEVVEVLPIGVDGRPVVRLPETIDDQLLERLRRGEEIDWAALPTGDVRIQAVGAAGVTGQPTEQADTAARVREFTPDHGLVRTDGTATRNAQAPAGAIDGRQMADADAAGGARCGTETGRNCFHPAVSLHRKGKVACSGVQIAPGWVLTAAHCFCGAAPPTSASIGQVTPQPGLPARFDRGLLGGTGPLETPVDTVALGGRVFFFGEHPEDAVRNPFCARYRAFDAMPAPRRTEVEVASLVATTDAAPALGALTPGQRWLAEREALFRLRDVALVRLSRPLVLAGRDTLAVVGDAPLLDAHEAFWIAGFGRNNWEADGGHKTSLDRMVAARRCTGSDPDGCVEGIEMRLYDDLERTDSCYGDSGAGIYAILPDGRLAVVGVVSRGTERACGPGSINALVTDEAMRTWLARLIGEAGLHTSPE